MKKTVLTNKLKADHKSDKAILPVPPKVKVVEQDSQNERIRKQFAQDDLIHQRIKCPVTAMVCCLMHQV